jgi:hypothetical protein
MEWIKKKCLVILFEVYGYHMFLWNRLFQTISWRIVNFQINKTV